MIVHRREVAFQDVDAAGLLFFGRFFDYCHEAMAVFFAPLSALEHGYVDLITRRRLGFPAVHLEVDFRAPLRFGDAADIGVTVPRVGSSSCTFRYAFRRVRDGADVATIDHVVVATSLDTMTKVPLPEDVRALLAAHPS